MSKYALKIQNLKKQFGNLNALDGLDLSIPHETIFGLIGPNGAGKTTSIRCIAGLLNPDDGSIEVCGYPVKGEALEAKKRLGFLFENTDDLYLYLKGHEYLEFVGEIHGLKSNEIQRRISILFSFLNIENYQTLLIDEYSKGMKKKIALASILLHDPELLILDEPFEGLDPITISDVKRLLKLLKAKGRTILITSHILAFIEDLCETVAIIDRGHIIYEGQIEQIRAGFNPLKYGSALEEVFMTQIKRNTESETELDWLK